MKKFLATLLLASPAFAAAWTVNTGTAQDSRFDRDRLKLNAATCATQGLAAGCTQSQARNAFCAKVGASAPCTANGQASGEILVYSTIGEYLDKYVIQSHADTLKAAQESEDLAAWEAAKKAATKAQKDAACAALGLPSGCLP